MLLSRLIGRIRRHWPNTHITIRGDGYYGREEVMTWCEGVKSAGAHAEAVVEAVGVARISICGAIARITITVALIFIGPTPAATTPAATPPTKRSPRQVRP